MEKINALIDEISDCYDIEASEKYIKENNTKYDVYPDSVRLFGDTLFFMAKTRSSKVLAVSGALAVRFTGDDDRGVKICACDLSNAQSLMRIFEFTRPVNHRGRDASLGL
ncbi:MAG: hypothetical protein PHO15_07450, partial [Eubacteriales bacterium]|nr:hypothetical protein [Eubacteriales bacterium]